MLRLAGVSLLLVAFVSAQNRPTPKWPAEKAVTFVDGPLTNEGYIDYLAALNERMGRDIKPEKNANVLIWKALGPAPATYSMGRDESGVVVPEAHFRRMGFDAPPKGDSFVNLQNSLRPRGMGSEEAYQAVLAWTFQNGFRPWQTKEVPDLAAYIELNEAPLALIAQAVRRPDYYNPLIPPKEPSRPGSLGESLQPGMRSYYEIADALIWRAMLRLEQGKVEEATQDLLACHRLGRLLARGGTRHEYEFGSGVEGLARYADQSLLDHPTVTPAQIRAYFKEIRALPALPPVADRFDLAGRFELLDAVQRFHRGGTQRLRGAKLEFAGAARIELQDPDDVEEAVRGIDWVPAFRVVNRWMDRVVEAARIADRFERAQRYKEIQKEVRTLERPRQSEIFTALLAGGEQGKAVSRRVGESLIVQAMGWVHHTMQTADCWEQRQRNLHIAFALTLYRRERNRYPATLAELAPAYLPEVPDDLFSGKPLVYKQTENSFLLYSVGPNGRDEQGRSEIDEQRGDDLRFILPLPRAVQPKP